MLSRCFSSNFALKNIRKISYAYKSFGIPQNVLKEEITKSRNLQINEVAVKLLAAPINSSDLFAIEGISNTPRVLPSIAGTQGVGIVTSIGPSVNNIKEGDHCIFTGSHLGTWCNDAIVHSNNLHVIPDSVDIFQAATLLSHAAAYHILNDFIKLRKGDVVIQSCCHSSIGQSIVQQCAAREIKTINILSKNPFYEKIYQHLFTHGANIIAHEQYVGTYRYNDFSKEMQSPRLAIDGTGGKLSLELARKLNEDGVFVTYGNVGRQPLILPPSSLINKNLKVTGFSIENWIKSATRQQIDDTLSNIIPMVLDSKLISYCKKFSMKELPYALKYAQFPYNYRTAVLYMED